VHYSHCVATSTFAFDTGSTQSSDVENVAALINVGAFNTAA